MHRSDPMPPASTADSGAASVPATAAPARRPRAARTPAEPPVERTVDETIALYRGQWILMKVTGFYQDGWPERGWILAHSLRRGDISKALAKEPPRSDRPPDAPYGPYYIFRAFPRIRSGFVPERSQSNRAPKRSRSGERVVSEGVRAASFYLQFSLDDPKRERWPVVPLAVGQDVVLEMLPNLLSTRSIISRRTLEDLRQRGLVEGDASRFLLSDLRTIGQPVPSVVVRVGPTASMLGVDGILGFDFFGTFGRIMLETRTLLVTLVDP